MTLNRNPEVVRRLLENYERLRADEKRGGAIEAPLPDLTAVVVTVEQGATLPPGDKPTNDMWQAASSLAADLTGWARRKSGVCWKVNDRNGKVDTSGDLSDPADGPPLYGEWTRDDGAESYHLRPDAAEPGLFRLWTYTERPLGSDLRDGEFVALCQKVRAIWPPVYGEDKGDAAGEKAPIMRRAVRYRVYWSGSADDPCAIRRVLSRFVGFGDENVRLRSPNEEAGK